MNRQVLKELGKSLLIFLLAINAVYLTGRIVQLDIFGENNTISANPGQTLTVEQRSDMAARPLTIVMTSTENAHHGVKYDGAALAEVHSWLSAIAGEALGSSGEPVQVSSRAWENAIRGQGVFFDFIYDQSIATMAQWLGVEISSDISLHTGRRFCLAVEGNAVALYYIRAADGVAYRCDTALNASRLLQRLEGYMPNGTAFAFENHGEYSDIDPYYCILDSIGHKSGIAAEYPLQNTDGSALLNKFGMNSLVANNYVEEDGTKVFIEDERALRLSADGRVLYSRMQGEVDELTVGTAEIISMAYSLAMSMPGADSWTLQMSGVSYDQSDNEYTVCFDYLTDGMMICFGGRKSAMEFVIDGGGNLRRADLICRSYTAQGDTLPMPERQALAVVSSMGGGEPMLCYADTGETVEPKWVIMN